MTPGMWLASVILWTAVILYIAKVALEGNGWVAILAVAVVALILAVRWARRRR